MRPESSYYTARSPDPLTTQYTTCFKINKKPRSKLGSAALPPITAERITTLQSPHWYDWLQWDASHLPPKLPIPLRRSPPPSGTPIPRPTLLITPYGIQIQSAVLSQYILRIDRQTDTCDWRQVCTKTCLRCILTTRLTTTSIFFPQT